MGRQVLRHSMTKWQYEYLFRFRLIYSYSYFRDSKWKTRNFKTFLPTQCDFGCILPTRCDFLVFYSPGVILLSFTYPVWFSCILLTWCDLVVFNLPRVLFLVFYSPDVIWLYFWLHWYIWQNSEIGPKRASILTPSAIARGYFQIEGEFVLMFLCSRDRYLCPWTSDSISLQGD